MKDFKIYLLLLFIICPTVVASQVFSGKVIFNEKPLKDVNVVVLETNRGTVTNERGFFSITAAEGNILEFSHIGMETMKYEIYSREMAIVEMFPAYNKLDEVVVEAEAEGIVKSPSYKTESFNTIFGEQTIESRGYSITQINGSDLNLAAPESAQVPAIVNALNGKVANYRITTDGVILRSNNSIRLSNIALWEVDGVTYDGFPPPVDIASIKDVNIIRGIAGTTKYGTRGSGGVIIVTTKNFSAGTDTSSTVQNNLLNKKVYLSNAIPYDSINGKNDFAVPLTKRDLSDTANDFENDINTLRGLAYKLQSIGKQSEAAQLYRRVLSIHSHDGRTHRDVAQTWSLMNKPLKAWKAYMFWLREVRLNPNVDIDEVIFHEMEKLYVTENLKYEVKESFKLQTDFSDSEDLISRVVLEWSNTGNDLEIEVVNPQQQTYTLKFGPLLESNPGIKEFFLDGTLKGFWLFNASPKVLGPEPLHLKVSIYSNWNNTKRPLPIIKLYTFSSKDSSKYQLFNLKM